MPTGPNELILTTDDGVGINSPQRRTFAKSIASLRKKLLNIGTRNKLVDMKINRQKLRIVDELPDEIFRILWREERGMTLIAKPAPVDEPLIESRPCLPDGQVHARHKDRKLQTNLAGPDLRKALLSVYRRAAEVEEEQGVSTLFLALGTLCWFEDASSQMARHAPLLLLPVNMERASVNAPFRLVPRDQDLELNYSLRAKLRNDFDLHLPDLPAGDAWLPSTYFQQVAKSIASQERWEVDKSAFALDCFSYAKFLMWKDLERMDADRHAFLRSLLVRDTPEDDNAMLDAEDVNLDQAYPDPRDTAYILDADSSQTRVIEAVRRGSNLAIQGPPGTGKSQTIANIIAAAVDGGQRVLFVAEKKVALDVVYERLQDAGLGPLCLELHSNKANRKTVYGNLRETLSGFPTPPAKDTDTYDRLRAVREALNRDDHCMHRPDEVSGETPYSIMGHLSLLERKGVRTLPGGFEIKDADMWSGSDFDRHRKQVKRLAERVQSYGVPSEHPWRQASISQRLDPMEQAKLLDAIDLAATSLDGLRDVLEALSASQGPCLDNRAARALVASLREVPDAVWSVMGDKAPAEKFDAVQDLCEQIAQWQQMNRHLLTEVDAASVDADDWTDLKQRLQDGSGTLLRFFDRNYLRCLRRVNSRLQNPKSHNRARRMELMQTLVAHQELGGSIRERGELGKVVWGDAWNGVDTDVSLHLEAVRWVSRHTPFPMEVQRMVRRMPSNPPPSQWASRLDKALGQWDTTWQVVLECTGIHMETVFGEKNAETVRHDQVKELLTSWQDNREKLDAAFWLQSEFQKVEGTDIRDFGRLLGNGGMQPDESGDLLEFAFAQAVWRRLRRSDSRLSEIKGEVRTAQVHRFGELDKGIQQVKAHEIVNQHAVSLPNGTSGQMGLLRGEMAKKTRHLRIRKLLAKAGTAVSCIKPVFMMSPISVAQYLDPDGLKFDMLIIDEASQVRPEDALGCILRARQIVVVGDQKQLPPTSFFERQTSNAPDADDDSDEDLYAAQVDDMESILTLCEARGMPQGMLHWHYRSQHPSLIRVSNREFYNNNLFIPPSPQYASGDLGMKFQYVAGLYEDQRNRKEAEVVADAVQEHAHASPALSLGVVTLSLKQQTLVQDLLEHRCRQDPELDRFCMAGGEKPPFFVKNLENVQGDERDVIMVSVGYGPDKTGRIHQRFGPIAQQGGERRLNVLFTRSRVRCAVFSSMRHEDIRINANTPSGTRALKTFLQYAETGEMDSPAPTGREMESPFEEAVADFLRGHNYEPEPQVGDGSFRIDLAVRDPERPGVYMLAVECDGARYHSAGSARERDRHRQSILEGKGWTFHRIWSTDWFHNREVEQARLLEACRKAVAHQDHPTLKDKVPAPQGLQQEADTLVVATDSPPAAGTPSPAMEYAEAELVLPIRPNLNLLDASKHEVGICVDLIVEAEGPVHQDVVVHRLVRLWGYRRSGRRLQERILEAINASVNSRHVQRGTGDAYKFLTIPGKTVDFVRNRRHASSMVRSPQHLPPTEIRLAIARVVRDCVGVDMDGCTLEVAKAFGCRSSEAFRALVDGNIHRMIADEDLVLAGGELRMPQVERSGPLKSP